MLAVLLPCVIERKNYKKIKYSFQRKERKLTKISEIGKII